MPGSFGVPGGFAQEPGRVRRYNERAPLLEDWRVRGRQPREFVAMLRAREAARRLADRVPAWDREREPACAEASRRMRAETTDMLLDLDRMLSARPHRRALGRLRARAADFEYLMRR